VFRYDPDVVIGTLLETIRPYVDSGQVPGAVVGMLRDGEVALDAIGTTTPGGGPMMTVDTLMRISSNTKPIAATLALALAEDGALALDDPVERFIPELADRRVLRRTDGPLDDTVPAARLITIDDLLTMRLGFGFVLEGECPVLDAAAEAGLGIGPPDPSTPLTPQAWIERFAELPLLDQPGTVWRYDLAYGVLGIVLARAGGRPLDELLRVRLLDPLRMADTAFVAAPGRLPPCFAGGESGLAVFDAAAADSRWATRPSFPDARGGLVSSATDLLRFAEALLGGGGGAITADAVAAMTADRLTHDQRRAPSAQAFLDGFGWGYGVQVVAPALDAGVTHRRYGWGGGLGTLWYSWPEQHTAAVLLTQVLPLPAGLAAGFVHGVETVLDTP
jgi:CubicO group peptidase (beta-lactamase class C family)